MHIAVRKAGKNGSVRVVNRTRGDGVAILEEAQVARTFWRRLVGLLGKNFLPRGRGLVIWPCRSVHTVGMAFPIDVAFVDREGRICTILEQMKPGRFSPTVKDALYVIEAPAGTFREVGAELHDEVALEKLPDSA